MNKNLYTLIIFSENLPGILNQVTNVFTRQQVNIESLNVSPSGTDGVHRYTITCWTTEKTISIITRQIERKIDVIKAFSFLPDEVYIMEQALYKISTPQLLANRNISKVIRLYDSKIVEVNPTYAIVSKEGLPEDIMELYAKLKEFSCLLQYASSGVVAVMKSHREELMEFFAQREEESRERRSGNVKA